MSENEIDGFLAICHHKTVSAAALSLYITQSSLSTRLKTLEKELGGELFCRKKGGREMILTPAGKKFYELAKQYKAIINQMQLVCKNEKPVLRISSLNSLGTYFLPEVYDLFLQKFPQINLEIQDMELENASNSIFNGLTDIAFTSGHTEDERLTQIPIFKEPMVLIYGENITFDTPVTIAQLSRYREVSIEWSHKFDKWHKKTFCDFQPQITISIMAQLRQFMEYGEYWSIVPLGVANGLAVDCKIHKALTEFPLPLREISILKPCNDENITINYFFECLYEILEKHSEIEVLI